MSQSERYTAAAYLVVFVAVLVYVVIIGAKLQRLQREVEQLVGLVRENRADALSALLARAPRLRRGRLRLHERSHDTRCDLGRPARLARADRAPRRAGRRSRRIPLVELGRHAQPVRLVPCRNLPDLGL